MADPTNPSDVAPTKRERRKRPKAKVELPAAFVEAQRAGLLPWLPLPTTWPKVVRDYVSAFRVTIELAIWQRTGQIDLWTARRIKSCCKALGHEMLVDRQLGDETLTPDQRGSLIERSMRLAAECERGLRDLGLDGRDQADQSPYAAFLAARRLNGPMTPPNPPDPKAGGSNEYVASSSEQGHPPGPGAAQGPPAAGQP